MAPSSSKRHLLMISAGGSFLAPFMVSALTVAIPTIGVEFKMDAIAMSWLATVFFLAASMFLIPFGRLADIYGVKRVFSIGVGIYFISALFAAIAPSAPILIMARFMTGIGAAMVFGTSFALLSLSLSEKERGAALGINIASNITGFALGFFLGGVLTYYLNWRYIFLLTLPISFFVAIMIRDKLPGECALSKGQRFDGFGSALIALELFLLIRGLTELPSLRGSLLVLGGVAVLSIYMLRQSRITQPVIDMGLFRRNRCFSFSNIAIMIYTTSNLAAVFLFSLYLQYIRGLDARSAGLILLAPTLVTATLTIYAGRLSDRKNLYKMASIGVVLSLAGLLFMTHISTDTPIPIALMEMILISAGGAFFYPPLMKIILGSISKDRYAMGSSLAETMRLIGNATSMAIVSIGFAIHLKGTDITMDIYPEFLLSMKEVLAAFAVLCTASLVLIQLASHARPKKSVE